MALTSYRRRAPVHQSMHGYPVPGVSDDEATAAQPSRGTRTGSRINANPGGKPSPESHPKSESLIDAPSSFERDRQAANWAKMSPAQRQGMQEKTAADQYRKGRYGDIKTLPAKGSVTTGNSSPPDTSKPSKPSADTPNADRVVRGALDSMSSGAAKSPMATGSGIRGLKPFTTDIQKPKDDAPAAKASFDPSSETSRSDKGDVTYKSGAGIVADSGGKRLVSQYGSGGTGRYGVKNDNSSGNELKQMIADGRANVDPSKRWASGDAKPNPTTPKSPLTLLASANPSAAKTDAAPSTPAQTGTSEQRVASQQKERDATYKASLPSQADKEAKWRAEGKDPRVASIMEKTNPAPGLADIAAAQSKKQNKTWDDDADRSSAISSLATAQKDYEASRPAAVKGIEATGRAAKYVAGGVGSAVTGAVKTAANAVDAGAKLFTGDAAAQAEAKKKLDDAKRAASGYSEGQ